VHPNGTTPAPTLGSMARLRMELSISRDSVAILSSKLMNRTSKSSDATINVLPSRVKPTSRGCSWHLDSVQVALMRSSIARHTCPQPRGPTLSDTPRSRRGTRCSTQPARPGCTPPPRSPANPPPGSSPAPLGCRRAFPPSRRPISERDRHRPLTASRLSRWGRRTDPP
jgi:hypothetical protein